MLKKLGKYEVIEEVGRGAMGEVYKARDPLIGRPVALKTITSSLVGNKELLERFYREARSAGALEHPNIVTIYELGKDSDIPFIAMEFLEGESLEKIIDPGECGRVLTLNMATTIALRRRALKTFASPQQSLQQHFQQKSVFQP